MDTIEEKTKSEMVLRRRLDDLDERYRDRFPKWTNGDLVAAHLTLAETSRLRAENKRLLQALELASEAFDAVEGEGAPPQDYATLRARDAWANGSLAVSEVLLTSP